MDTPVVSREELINAVKQLSAEVLPEVAGFIEFVKFKALQKPQGHQPNRTDSEQQALRAALIKATRGMFADVPTSSDEFARRKREEIDRSSQI